MHLVPARSANLVIVLAICLALVCSVTAGLGRLPIIVVLTPAVLAGGVMTLRHPKLALSLLPVIGACIPFGIGTGSQSPLVAALLLAGFLVGLGGVHAIRTPDWSSGALVTWPSVALILVWIVAMLWSNIELSPLVTLWATFPLAQLGGTAVAIISTGILLIAMQTTRNGPWIAVSTWSFIVAGIIAMAGYLVGQLVPLTLPFETGGLFTMWVVALSLGQGLFNQRLNWIARAGLIGLGLGWEYKAAVMQTWWFSGWLPSLVVITILLFLRSRVLFGAVAALAGCVAAVRFNDLYAVVWGTTVDKGDLSRLDIWQQSLDLFAQHPILGTGPAGYAVYFQSIYAGSAFSMSTHNNYMDVLAQTGIVGAIAFAWLMVTLLVVGWRARSLWSDGFYGGFAQGAFAGLLGLFIAMAQGDWFIPFVYNQTIAGFRFTIHSWVFLGFLAGLGLLRLPGAGSVQLGVRHRDTQLEEWFSEFLTRVQPDLFHSLSSYLFTVSLLDAARRVGVPTIASMHDYWYFCPRIILQRSDGQRCDGNTTAEDCARCILHERRRYRLAGKVEQHVPGWLKSDALRRMVIDPNVVQVMEDRRAHLDEALRSVDLVTTPARLTRELMLARGFSPDRVLHIRHGIRQPASVDISDGPEDGRLRVAYMGQLAPHKGVHVLIEAARMVKPGARSLELTIYGNADAFPKYAADLKRLADGAPNVRFAGSYNNQHVWEVLRAADTVVVPSLWFEISPLVILESFAAGVPVVASDLRNMNFQIRDGVDGLLFEPGSARSLADKLQTLVDNPGQIHALRGAIQPTRTLESELTEIEATYHVVLRQRRTTPVKQTARDEDARQPERQAVSFERR